MPIELSNIEEVEAREVNDVGGNRYIERKYKCHQTSTDAYVVRFTLVRRKTIQKEAPLWEYIVEGTNPHRNVLVDTMPDWWLEPWDRRKFQVALPASMGGDGVAPGWPNGVVLVLALRDGRVCLRQFGYVSATGRRVQSAGRSTLYTMELNPHETPGAGVIRLGQLRFGLQLQEHCLPVGQIYDPAEGRWSHIYTTTQPFDRLMLAQRGASGLVDWLIDNKSMSQNMLWAEDLDGLQADKRLSNLAKSVFRNFKQLRPPLRPVTLAAAG